MRVAVWEGNSCDEERLPYEREQFADRLSQPTGSVGRKER